MAKKLKPEIARTYKYSIQEPLHEHRDEMASKFENRIDYVDISAYGIGKVNMESPDQIDKLEAIEREIEEKTMDK